MSNIKHARGNPLARHAAASVRPPQVYTSLNELRQSFGQPIVWIGTCTRGYYGLRAHASTACNQKGNHTMSDITLSTGIRQNLLSLQQTSADLTTTQEQLATGKKVNTAFDNPQSYFTSQSLTNRANDLSALLDQIGQAQQTLNAANDGLTGLTSLLEQALSTAQQAQQASNDTAGATTGTVSLEQQYARCRQPS